MKKRMKVSFAIILGVLLFNSGIMFAQAKELTLGKASYDSNIAKVPVTLVVNQNETVAKVEVVCNTDTPDVSCKVVAKEISDVSSIPTNNSKGVIFEYNGDAKTFPLGNTVLADIELTNVSTKTTDVKVSLTGSTIDGEEFDVSQNLTIEVKKSSNDTLTRIETSVKGTLLPEFAPETTDYTLFNIKDTINSIKIITECDNCHVDIDGDTEIKNNTTVMLKQGENNITLTVTSEDGAHTRAYTIKIIRGETNFNSDELAEITAGDYILNPAFDSKVLAYKLTVPYNVRSLTDILKYTAKDAGGDGHAKVTVTGLEDLIVGENKITIVVDNAYKNSSKTYTLTVTRLKEQDIIIVKYLNKLVTYQNADGTQMSLSIDEFAKQFPEEYQKIMNNDYQFDAEGNVVTDKPEPVEPNPEPTKEKNDNRIWLIILLVVAGIAIIVVSGILIFKKPKKDKESVSVKTEEETIDDTVEINEEGIEEELVRDKTYDDVPDTTDVDLALNDLMQTKQYEFKDEDISD